MTPEKVLDPVALLADARIKRGALDALIAALEGALTAGALGPGIEGASIASAMSVAPMGQPVDLPAGAFLGKSLPDAIKLYLEAKRQRKTAKEIAAALREGGVVSTSDDFDAVVQAALQRMKSTAVLLKFADGWGLSEWSPPSFRTSAKTTATAKRRNRAKVRPAKKPKQALGLEARIEEILISDKTKVFRSKEIAEKLEANAGSVALALGKMASKNKAEKAGGGAYRAFSGNVQEMPLAG
jgi:hypothetical protein